MIFFPAHTTPIKDSFSIMRSEAIERQYEAIEVIQRHLRGNREAM
jgi:hypothetical protein